VQEIHLIELSLVNNDWTNFERIAIAEYGSAVEFNAYNYGTITDIDSFRNIIENSMAYLGDATPNITGYAKFINTILTGFVLHCAQHKSLLSSSVGELVASIARFTCHIFPIN
jgi:hypothetical protein